MDEEDLGLAYSRILGVEGGRELFLTQKSAESGRSRSPHQNLGVGWYRQRGGPNDRRNKKNSSEGIQCGESPAGLRLQEVAWRGEREQQSHCPCGTKQDKFKGGINL